jgi:transposase
LAHPGIPVPVPQGPLAIEAVRRIDEIFAVEREINGAGSEQRHAVRQERIKALVAALEGWMRTERARLCATPTPPRPSTTC